MNERQLSVGDIKSIRSNGGKTLDYVELLFSPTTVAKFDVDRENNMINMSIDNTDFKYQDLNCSLSKTVIRDLLTNLREIYAELA